MKLIQRITTLAVASAVALSLTAAPANADQRTFRDETRSGRSGDIRSATVNHTNTKIVVKSNVNKISAMDEYTLWIDTDSRDAGPEFKMGMMPNSDYVYIVAVETFKSRGTAVRCTWPSWHAYANTFSKSPVIEFAVARNCIGNPSKLRISLKADFRGSTPTDYLYPGKDRFTGWIAR